MLRHTTAFLDLKSCQQKVPHWHVMAVPHLTLMVGSILTLGIVSHEKLCTLSHEWGHSNDGSDM